MGFAEEEEDADGNSCRPADEDSTRGDSTHGVSTRGDGTELTSTGGHGDDGGRKEAVRSETSKGGAALADDARGDNSSDTSKASALRKFVQRMWAKAEGLGVKVRILVALFQMLQGIGITFSISYPPLYTEVLNWFGSILTIDLPQAMPLGCVINTGFFVSLITRTAMPLSVMLALAAAGNVLASRGRAELANMCSTGWFFILFLVYPSCSSAIFQALICDPLEDGTMMLRVDYSVTCWQGEHVPMLFYAIFMAFVYPIGTPLLYCAMLYGNSDVLEKIKRAELVADAEDAKREAWNRSLDGSKHTDESKQGTLQKAPRSNH